jgi:acetylornithine deacetylase/succinyl-diaminopimelate desuccinylase-like protein
MAIDSAALDRYVTSCRSGFESSLAHLVSIPTVSMDPARSGDVRRGADAAAELLRSLGARADVLETEGNPVIFGRFETGSKHPTLTVYNHMDVQPADEPEWRRPPFELRIEGDRYYGRGATDDKGPALSALYGAKFAVDAGVPINLNFLWELEEEIGSPNLERLLRKRKRELKTDSVVVSDTIWISRQRPALSAGLRGLQGATLRLQTSERDVHSGLTGGAARNPVGEIAALIAELYDAKTGRVKIPGFHKDVVPASRAELASFQRSGFSIAAFKKAHGLRSLRFKEPSKVMRAIWAEPTLEVHGLSGGYHGPGIKTVIPPYAEAKLSMRLVPDQSPAKIFKLLQSYVKKLNPDVEVRPESSLAPFRGVVTGPLAEAARQAVRFGFGREPAFVREGGSIGAVVTLQKTLNCPVLFIGLSLPEHGYHAPNEFFDWGQAHGGMKTFARYFELVSSQRN